MCLVGYGPWEGVPQFLADLCLKAAWGGSDAGLSCMKWANDVASDGELYNEHDVCCRFLGQSCWVNVDDFPDNWCQMERSNAVVADQGVDEEHDSPCNSFQGLCFYG